MEGRTVTKVPKWGEDFFFSGFSLFKPLKFVLGICKNNIEMIMRFYADHQLAMYKSYTF